MQRSLDTSPRFTRCISAIAAAFNTQGALRRNKFDTICRKHGVDKFAAARWFVSRGLRIDRVIPRRTHGADVLVWGQS